MAATLTTPPASPAYNGNALFIELETDLVNTAAAGYIEITFSSTGPTVGQELTLEWGGNSLLLTVAAATNATATAIPTKSVSETLDEYAQRVAEALRENGSLSDEFQITFHSTGKVKLTAITAGVLAISTSSTLSNASIASAAGTDPNTEANLAAQVQVWKSATAFNNDELITTLHGTYDAALATTSINLSELFPVSAHLPNEAHIAPGLFLSWLRGDASSAYQAYYLRYADKYGTPAVPEALVKSDVYHILHGAHAADRPAAAGTPYIDILHNYTRADGEAFWKPIGDGQPDWLYVWTKTALSSCNIEFTITWDDGTDTTEAYGGASFNLSTDKVYYIRSTPLNFNYTPPSSGAIPWYITFRLVGDAGSGVQTLAELRYKAMPGNDWERFLLFDNGVGGCESVYFRGKTQESIGVSRENVRRARTSTFSIAAGEMLLINAEAQREYLMNTGWIESWYLDHLRQLLLGEVWLIDMVEERFVKLVCDTTSIKTLENDQELYSLSVKFKTAWVDKAI